MKRFLACFGCAAVLAASVSCTKDTTVAPEVKQGAIEITASVEGTRTSLEGADVRWSANDALGIFSGTKFVNAQFTTTDDNAASATFTGDATDAEGAEAAKAFAYYPYSENAVLEGTIVSGLEIPAKQIYAPLSFITNLNPMAAVGPEYSSLSFRSMGAVLQFKLTGTDTFNKVILTGNNNESIAGAYVLDFSEDVPAMVFSGDGKSITVECDEWDDDIQLQEDVATELHFVVPAGIEFTKGISIKIIWNHLDYSSYEYVDEEILTRTYTTPLTTVANKFYKVTEFKVEDITVGMDETLRKYLMKEYDVNKDGQLSSAEAEGVTYIRSDGFEGNIRGLEYISRLSNLEVLEITSNCEELYGISLENNPKLTTVKLSPVNGVSERLDASGLKALTTFELKVEDDKVNSLSRIDLSGCSSLKKVVVEGVKALSTLDLTDSEQTVEMFWLADCPEMTKVDISRMPITSFANGDDEAKGMSMLQAGTLIIATMAQKRVMSEKYINEDVAVTWWCVDEERTEVAPNVDPVLRAAILADKTLNPVGAVNTVITSEMAEKITEIKIESSQSIEGLASFAGLDAFPNLTRLDIQGKGALGDVDLSAYPNLTDITMSPSMSFKSIKLPSSIVKFVSIVDSYWAVGPGTLDLTPYKNLEVVMIATSDVFGKAIKSLSCKGLDKLHTLYTGSCGEVNISGCSLLNKYSPGKDDAEGFYWYGAYEETVITVGSEAHRDELIKSYEWWNMSNPSNQWVIEE